MAVKKLQNAYYITRDMDRAVAFYRDALGLSLTFQDGAKWAQMKAGDVNFSLSSPDEGAHGAWPTSCYPAYPLDGEEILRYIEACHAGEFENYMVQKPGFSKKPGF